MSQSSNGFTGVRAGTDGLARSDHHRLLASERRRLVLDVLQGRTTTVELGELAAGIVAREDGADAVDDATVEYVSVSLHHAHLPAMDELGILTYDSAARRVESCPEPPSR